VSLTGKHPGEPEGDSGGNRDAACLKEPEQENRGIEGYPKLSLKKRSPIAARNDDLKVFNGRR
jgi:hypothetical protein